MTKIQDLRDRVILLRRKLHEEKDGSFHEIWEDIDCVWAKIIPCFNREILGEGWNKVNPVSSVKYKVIIRNRRGQFSRIKWGELTLAMMGPPLRDPQNKWLTCNTYSVGEHND